MELKKLNLNEISPNPFQPREKFNEDELQQLADNIKTHGLIEPIVVTKKDQKYMVVAGERRWRAHKKAGMDFIYAIVKDYKTDADIKRDSLIENEMRENLNNSEFKAFVFSLAKSLGEPYFNKGYIDAARLSEYVTGLNNATALNTSTFYNKLKDLLGIHERASAKVKKLFEEEKIDRRTASNIASIEDKGIQDEMVDLAKTKSVEDVRKEVLRHNFQEQAREVRNKLEEEGEQNHVLRSEKGIVIKFQAKINKWNDEINYLSNNIKDNRESFKRFSHESRMEMLDSLKPLRRDLEKSLLLVTKLMEMISQ